MDSRDTAVLKKMRQHTQAILDYCGDCKDCAEFEENTMRVEATVFNLMQLGELAKQSLSEEAKRQITSIPWQQIYGLRNRISMAMRVPTCRSCGTLCSTTFRLCMQNCSAYFTPEHTVRMPVFHIHA